MINKDLKNYRKIFSKEFNKLEELGKPSYLYEPIKHIIKSEGKRLRPFIVQFLGYLFNNDSDDTINTAMGVVLLVQCLNESHAMRAWGELTSD